MTHTLSEQDFDDEMALVQSRCSQDWPAIVSQAADELQKDVPSTDMGNLLGLPVGFVGTTALIATMPTEGVAQTVLFVVGGIGLLSFMPLWVGLSERKVSMPRWARRAKIPTTKTLKADIEVNDDDASVFAVVHCSDTQEPSKVFLGIHNQEEIAQRFLQVKAICEQITQHNKSTCDKKLFAEHGLKPNGAPIKEKAQPALPTAQEQEQQMLLAANQELAKALKNALGFSKAWL